MTLHKDAASLNEMLFIAVALPSGVREIVFKLLGTGPETNLAEIGYSWPEALYEVEALVAKALR